MSAELLIEAAVEMHRRANGTARVFIPVHLDLIRAVADWLEQEARSAGDESELVMPGALATAREILGRTS